jgi:septum formation protein
MTGRSANYQWAAIDPNMHLILASGSPRRQELIHLLGVPWEVRVAEVDEDSVTYPDPAVNVIETALLKAHAVARTAPPQATIVAADTTVVLDGEMLNKPDGPDGARRMLQRLRGRVHQVYTGIVVMRQADGRTVRDVAVIDVPMRDYTDKEIGAYIDTGDPLDKAGAYAIQHPEFRPVTNLTGCFAGVVGLPLCHLFRALRRLDQAPAVDIAANCQAFHQYDCPVYPSILDINGTL